MDFCEIFKALGDETRLRILHLLSRQELCVCMIGEALGIPQPTVSKHLLRLRMAGLVRCRRMSQWCFCCVSDTLAGSPLYDCLLKMWASSRRDAEDLRRLQALLNSNVCCEQRLQKQKQ